MRRISKDRNPISAVRGVSYLKSKFLVICGRRGLCGAILPCLGGRVNIGSAQNFAVLAGTPNITNTGATTITGDVGISPAASITGKGPGADQITLTGAYHEADAVALTAQNDLTTAYTALNNMPATQTLVSNELGGLTLTSGVYAFMGTLPRFY